MNEKWKDLDGLYGPVPASFEARMLSALDSLEEKPKVRHLRFRPSALIAAVLIVALLAGTALATDFFGLKAFIVTDPYVDPVIATTAPETVGDRIALQGFPTSPEFQANAEWMEFLASLDLDLEQRNYQAGTSPAISDRYVLYGVYSPQMTDALDAITAKYGLRLHTSVTDFDSEQELYSLLGTDPFFTNCSAILGYAYEDGSFQGGGTSVAGMCYEYQFGRYVKGSFSEVTLNVGNAEDYEEWMYTTACGVDVQLSLGPSRCVLMADLPDSFVAVNLLGGANGDPFYMPEPVTRSDLETFADLFDFSALG